MKEGAGGGREGVTDTKQGLELSRPWADSLPFNTV